MEVLLLCMLLVLVIGSFFLEGSSLTWVSQSGIALLFGVAVGIFIVVAENHSYIEHFNFDNNLFFHVLLPPIIYEAGFSVKKIHFFSNFGAILSTAVVGTLIATGVTGGAIYVGGIYGWITPLSWIESFLFGALISAVDPVATLACFEKLNAPSQLFNIVFGESVLNDAVVIALYMTLNEWDTSAEFSMGGLAAVVGKTLFMLTGSLLVSVAITLFGAFLMNSKLFSRLHLFPAYEISLCIIFSLLAYFSGEALHLSGIVSLFFSGMMTSHYHFHTLSVPAQQTFRHLLHTMAFVCESLVFVFMGTSLVFVFANQTSDGITLLHLDWAFMGFTLALLLISRFLNIVPLLAVCNRWRRKEDRIGATSIFVIWFAGLRGAISFALVKTWSHLDSSGESHRPLIVSTTLMIVVFTTLILGGLTGPLLAYIGIASEPDQSPSSPKAPAEPRMSFVHSLAHGDLVNTDVRRRHPKPDHHDEDCFTLNDDASVAPVSTEHTSISTKLEKTWKNVDENYLKRWFGGRKRVMDDLHHGDAAMHSSIHAGGHVAENLAVTTPSSGAKSESPKASAYMPASPSRW
ncbi:sodium/hydrogen exchanger 3 [Aphanomyces invadans]|uniref:Sodium/hydrogen exchanger n=1 Tax=Aphanomyces invadans TaxID=157072 RepID=A0A024T9Q1_9STRA|nr:sodium/hydrogen exchanger 3 [Aphanomyces invadans]ETV90860.1 sodium/hydrogen exchanger 3 [Aphanomyces invadans]|eukprot:XP_008880496.1 sodium/hydrogen exchanger 3 [Aphanomyces invadans]